MKEYKIGEVFRHTDGKAYQCVEGETCEGCAFRCTGNDCVGPYCDGGSDGRPVKFIAVTEPVEGMLYCAKNGRMYRLAEGSHWVHWCACDDDPERSCAELDMAVFGCTHPGWHWSLVEEEDATSPVDPPKRHIELAVAKVEGDKVADIAKLETFNAAFGKVAQAKKLLDDALVQLDIFVHANQTNTDAQEYFDITQKAVDEICAAREVLDGH